MPFLLKVILTQGKKKYWTSNANNKAVPCLKTHTETQQEGGYPTLHLDRKRRGTDSAIVAP